MRSAAEDAREKASVLASASGVKLGALVSIEYDWNPGDFCSSSFYGGCKALPSSMAMKIDVEPEDEEISESVMFLWTME